MTIYKYFRKIVRDGLNYIKVVMEILNAFRYSVVLDADRGGLNSTLTENRYRLERAKLIKIVSSE